MKKFLKKAEKFVLKNKLLTVLIGLIFLVVLLGLIVIKLWLFPNSRGSKYGNRLDGIENVKLTSSRFDEIKNSFEGDEHISLDSFRLSGKIVNISISIKGDYKEEDIKNKSMDIINKFSDDEIKYYDFQVWVTFDDDRDPILFYKNKNSESLK